MKILVVDFLVHKKELLVPLEIILKIHFYVKQKLV